MYSNFVSTGRCNDLCFPEGALAQSSEVLGLSVVVVHHCQRLLLAGLAQLLPQVHPVETECLGVAVAAGQEAQGEAPQADPGLLEEPPAPA